MRLELNLPALERLIGGDTEFEAAIRQQIVNEFTRKHLKGIVDSQMVYRLGVELRQYIDNLAKTVFDLKKVNSEDIWPEFRDRIKDQVEDIIDQIVKDKIPSAIKSIMDDKAKEWANYVNFRIKQAIDDEVVKTIREGVQQRLEAAAKVVLGNQP